MLYYDCFFTIGKTHQVCEDYAVQGDTPMPFLIVCDGCSASPNSDVGARILSLSAKKLLEEHADNPPEYPLFGQQLIEKAQGVVEKMALSVNVLDSTVIAGFLHEAMIRVYVYGDGCLMFKNQAGELGCLEIGFTHNAPFYLTYWLAPERQDDYARYNEKPLFIADGRQQYSELLPYNTPLVFDFPLEQFQTVAIASDGASSCYNASTGTRVPLQDIAEQLLAFKNFEGEFVKRRSKRALEQMARQGVFPADDLSVGAFVQMTDAA